MNRTGIHHVTDRRTGQQAPARDCSHYGCQPPFHEADCGKLNLFPLTKYSEQRSLESFGDRRKGKHAAQD